MLDGGLATALEALGCDIGNKLWSASVLRSSPHLIAKAHTDFVQAGADVISTASYQASFPGFAQEGFDEESVAQLLRLSVQLARDARPRVVAASCGPYGAYLANGSEYRGYGDIACDEDTLVAFHAKRAQVLWDAGADLILFETLPCIMEARALIRVVNATPSMRAVCSFQCRDDHSLASGELFADAAAILAQVPQIIGFGCNCVRAEHVLPLYLSVKSLLGPHQQFWAYPNGGGLWDAKEKVWHAPDAHATEHLLELVLQWKQSGIRIIGGCCQVSAQTIAQLKNALK